METFDYSEFEVAIYRECTAVKNMITAALNMCDVVKHINKFGITEENKSLFAASFEAVGIQYSKEGIVSTIITTIKDVLVRIGKFIQEKIVAIGEAFVSAWKKVVDKFKKVDKPLPKDKIETFNKAMAGRASTEGFHFEFGSGGEIGELKIDKYLAELKEGTNGTWVRNKQNGYFMPVTIAMTFIDMYMSYCQQCIAVTLDHKDDNQVQRPNYPQFKCVPAYDGGWSDINKLDLLVKKLDTHIGKMRTLKSSLQKAINEVGDGEDNETYLKALRDNLSILQTNADMCAKISNACSSAIRIKNRCFYNHYDDEGHNWGDVNIPTFTI